MSARQTISKTREAGRRSTMFVAIQLDFDNPKR